MAKFFLVLTIIASGVAAYFGWMTDQKITEVKGNLTKTTKALDSTQKQLTKADFDLKDAQAARDKATNDLAAKTQEAQNLQNDKTTLQTQLDSVNAQLAKTKDDLDKANAIIASYKPGPQGPTSAPTTIEQRIADLQKHVDELTQLNATLTKQKQESDDRLADLNKKIEDATKKRHRPGIQGMVMAVNPGWNFAVISIGDQQGAVPNADVLVERGGTQIAKMKITTVEPAISIADIVPDSVAKGQRVMPGDKVIFTGTTAP